MKNIGKWAQGRETRAYRYIISGALFVSIALLSCGGGGGYGGGGGGMAVLPPQAFSLSMPADGSMGVGTAPTLTWTASLYATGYTVQVSTTNTFAAIAASTTVAATQWTVSPALAPATTYFWRVKASNLYGTMTEGPFSFTT